MFQVFCFPKSGASALKAIVPSTSFRSPFWNGWFSGPLDSRAVVCYLQILEVVKGWDPVADTLGLSRICWGAGKTAGHSRPQWLLQSHQSCFPLVVRSTETTYPAQPGLARLSDLKGLGQSLTWLSLCITPFQKINKVLRGLSDLKTVRP